MSSKGEGGGKMPVGCEDGGETENIREPLDRKVDSSDALALHTFLIPTRFTAPMSSAKSNMLNDPSFMLLQSLVVHYQEEIFHLRRD